ncbi:MAG: hypothetical protein J6W52_12880 [Bacteroidaceae bacterium]|nr:hypothetical protein [Bacteroidaceae bacterium]
MKISKIVSFLFACSLCTNILAQSNGSSSSYSRFGLGTLENQAQGFNKAMGGVGLGFRAGNRINTLNPASYSAIDSITFLMDAGMTASFGNMKQNGNRINVHQCKLDYVNIGLRLYRNCGLSVGFMPYSTIGYDFNSINKITKDPNTQQTITSTTNYSGDGGLHQAYLGIGLKVYKELSLGANASFVWGDYEHAILQIYSTGNTTSSYNGLNSVQSAKLTTWKLDLGAQYPIRLTQSDVLTIGATASIGHKIKSDASMARFTDQQDDDAPIDTVRNAFDLPYTYGIGATWNHKGKLIVGLDFKQEFWGSCHTPQIVTVGSVPRYISQTGAYKDRIKIAVGVQYTPAPFDPHYWKRVQYRVGANYSTPYLKINGANGPKEYSLTAGMGLPITNIINNRSMVNIGVEWLRRTPGTSNLITENYIMLNLGLTFNEAWFGKYKIQ